MMQFKKRSFALILLLFLWGGCNRSVNPQPEPIAPDVYLLVTAKTSDMLNKESINTDSEDFEDHVYNLAMLVFDSDTGEKVAEHFSSSIGNGASTYVFTAKLKPGQRDFFFVANIPSIQASMENIANKTAMNDFMATLRKLDPAHYLSATKDKGFPMTRVYLNQTVSTGGTISQPLPFKPTGEENVKLERVIAKLEVNISEGAENLQKIELHNANAHFRLGTNKEEPIEFYKPIDLRRVGSTNQWLAYMPEAYIPNTKYWGACDNVENKPINYFRIITKGGIVYDIPIITHEATIPGGQYLPFAKGELEQKPNYMIYRNHHYRYQIKNMPDKIEIKYSITDWNVITKDIYMGYGYNVEVDKEGNITVTNTIQNCAPHNVWLEAQNGAYFANIPTSTKVKFEQLSNGASQSFKINKDNVNVGNVYLAIYYNRIPSTGAIPDNVFIKK